VPTAARYDGLADWYDGYVTGEVAAFTATAAETLERLVGAGSGRCLDVGCGTGVLTAALARLGWSAVGIDISSDQLRVARLTLGESVELVQADAAELPFGDASFDAVVAGPGVRSRVGVRHVPLAELLNGVSDAGLALEKTVEDYGDPPLLLALAARKPEKRSTT
jgi:ubiquinone/menaquinone biosynthesis C-methylase UbiE